MTRYTPLPALVVTGLLLAQLIVLGSASDAHADADCDYPMVVQQGAVAPNVLLVLDNSGSMREAIYHEDFDPTSDHFGDFDIDSTYWVSSDGLYRPSDFNAGWSSSPEAPLVSSQPGQSGRYSGNYLNWIYFHATDEQRAALPQITRIEVGKAALSSVLSQASGLRYGLMTFHDNDGGILELEIGADTSALLDKVNATPIRSSTPAAETLVDALEYFQRTDASAPIQYECQDNFIILVTDGYPQNDLDIPLYIGDQDGDGNEPGDCESIGAINASNCSDYLDDVAYYLAHNDMRPDLDGDQFVRTYTIGFGIDAPLLADTAINGGGQYLTAWNLSSLVQSLGTIVGDIVSRVSAGGSVAVVATEQSSGDALYRGKFMPGLWRGYLEAHSVPFVDGAPPLWEAGELLKNRNANDRVLFTWEDGQMMDFDPSHADELANELVPGFSGSDGTADANTVQASEKIVRFVLGEDQTDMRERDGWKLGDLVYSTPLIVGAPSHFYLDPAYQSFLVGHASRERMIYVGGNDGMLHAFRASDGHELWAYVPSAVLDKLHELTDVDYCHKSFVDLSPVAHDLYLNGAWRTVLIGGERTGGDSYFAIDVTDPFSPYVLWETSIPEIVSSFSQPTIVRTATGTYMWVGSAADPNGLATVAVLNVETGALTHTTTVSTRAGAKNLASAAAAYDADWDGLHDFLYHGDLDGNLWRWDLSDSDPSNWTAETLFIGSQPIQARPTLSLNESGDAMVYFGTGSFLDNDDVNDTSTQSFYCLIDDGTVTDLTQSDLVDQTSSIDDVSGSAGWFIDLVQGSGERVVEPATLLEGVVYFTSFSPSVGACSGGGESWLYRMDYRNAAEPQNHDGSTVSRVESLGEGVASSPVLSLADESLLVQTSDARLSIMDLATSPLPIIVHAWQETFDPTGIGSTGGSQ